MQNQDVIKFEFLLTLGGNIIIQRFFNVKGYNTEAKRSMELFYCVEDICEGISADLKLKNLEYMYENLNFYQNPENVEEEEITKEENFLLEVKLNDDVFIQRIFPAHIYHPKARYSVDIRPKVRGILAELTDVLSSESFETTYLQYEL